VRGRRGKNADLSCSRNARPQKALVGRAQVRFSVLTPHREGETSELGREVARQLAWSLCSQSPHDKAVVTRCAQWRPHQPPRPSRLPVIRSHPHKRQRDFLLGKGYSSVQNRYRLLCCIGVWLWWIMSLPRSVAPLWRESKLEIRVRNWLHERCSTDSATDIAYIEETCQGLRILFSHDPG